MEFQKEQQLRIPKVSWFLLKSFHLKFPSKDRSTRYELHLGNEEVLLPDMEVVLVIHK